MGCGGYLLIASLCSLVIFLNLTLPHVLEFLTNKLKLNNKSIIVKCDICKNEYKIYPNDRYINFLFLTIRSNKKISIYNVQICSHCNSILFNKNIFIKIEKFINKVFNKYNFINLIYVKLFKRKLY